MALRDQPYLPLYIQDVLTDEKLIECSAEAHGVYFRLLCLLHKQETYGKIKLKAKYKQNKSNILDNDSNILDFAEMLQRQMPFDTKTIYRSLHELIEEKVLFIEDDFLCQKRMIKDCDLSEKRAISGAMGGKKSRNSGIKRYYNEPGYLYLVYDKDDSHAFKVGISAEPEKRIKGIMRKSGRNNLMFRRKWKVEDMGENEQLVLDYFDEIRDGEWIYGEFDIQELESQISQLLKQKQNKSKTKANSEYENEYENENKNEYKIEKEGKGGKRFKKPTVEEIKEYCEERKNGINAQSFFDHYEARGWVPKGYTMQMKDWKAAVRTWEKNNSNYKTNGSNQQSDKRSDKRINDYWD